MNVFLSWSGERSRMVAEALRTWLPRVLQSVKPWMSDVDISAGTRWLSEISAELDASCVGVVCVTPENLASPWLHFEAGALSKAIDQSRICPIGLDLSPGQITGPLSQFQANSLDQAGVFRILAALNRAHTPEPLQDSDLREIVAVWWPKLEERVQAIPPSPAPRASRSTEEQLEELLQISREHLRRENLRLEGVKAKDDKLDEVLAFMERAMDSFLISQAKFGKAQPRILEALQQVAATSNETEATAMIEGLVSVLPSAAFAPGDAKRMAQFTKDLKSLQAEDRARLEAILQSPNTIPSAPNPHKTQ